MSNNILIYFTILIHIHIISQVKTFQLHPVVLISHAHSQDNKMTVYIKIANEQCKS